ARPPAGQLLPGRRVRRRGHPVRDFFGELTGGGRFEYLWEQDSGPNAQPNPPGSLGAAERSYQRMVELRGAR
ncbi:hypothetical protein, partial [Micromonospora sp. ATA51]|uniref:hypothetical protein n=1 Tax=Micromonospora sp. ATA51 TaxID=2806098 RepID=UPI001EE4C22A